MTADPRATVAASFSVFRAPGTRARKSRPSRAGGGSPGGETAQRRSAAIPRLRIHPNCRFFRNARRRITEAIRAHPVVIFCGETGSGKHDALPKICMELAVARAV